MAKEKNFDNLDAVIESADLIENEKPKEQREKKRKTIMIFKDWERKIKEYHGGTIASYIHIAIQEKMKRDGIL